MPKDDLVYLRHMLQTLRESARRVSREFKDVHPEIPWNAAIGMRHHVVHDYMYVDDDILWSTAAEDLPPLIAALEKIVPSE